MTGEHFFRKLRRDDRGSVLIEFAFLGPVVIVAMIGVFHVAIYMQNFNSLRSVASDTARRIMVEYQKDNQLTPTEIRAVARGIAVGAPYNLETSQLAVTVKEEPTSRIDGAIEYNLELAYRGEDFMPIPGFEALNMNYDRPIFVVTESDDEEEEEEEE